MELRKYMNPPEPLYDIEKIRYNFGLVMRSERKRRNLTQMSMAMDAEYSPSVIASTESGRNTEEMMGLVNFLKTLNALHMTADEYLAKCQIRRTK